MKVEGRMAIGVDLSLVIEFNGEKHRVYKRGDRFVAKDCEYGFSPRYDATRSDADNFRERQLMRYTEPWDLTGTFVAYESEVGFGPH
jgi:hypothetical protein